MSSKEAVTVILTLLIITGLGSLWVSPKTRSLFENYPKFTRAAAKLFIASIAGFTFSTVMAAFGSKGLRLSKIAFYLSGIFGEYLGIGLSLLFAIIISVIFARVITFWISKLLLARLPSAILVSVCIITLGALGPIVLSQSMNEYYARKAEERGPFERRVL